jgi:hypothetical protein
VNVNALIFAKILDKIKKVNYYFFMSFAGWIKAEWIIIIWLIGTFRENDCISALFN